MVEPMPTALRTPLHRTRSSVVDDVDERWPTELRLLLGPDAGELLAVFVDRCGGRVVGQSRATQVAHQPRGTTTVTYHVEVARPSGERSRETVVARTGDRVPSGATELTNGLSSVAMWRWPDDPLLPGLSAALDTERVATLFGDLGIGGGACTLRVRAYRAGRRAVVEAHNDRGRIFLKVVRPDRARGLHDLHRSLADRLPVPNSVGWTDDGIVVLPAVPGVTLRSVLRSGDSNAPDPASIGELLDALPDELAGGSPRRHWLDLARHHADVVCSTVPSLTSDVETLLDRLGAHHDRYEGIDHPVVAIHGDLYEAQLIVDHGRLAGLLDVDTAGAGHRIDDLANFCAHLSVLATVTPSAGSIRRYGAQLLTYAETSFERHDLRARVAGSILGLATGCFRVLEPDWIAKTSRRIALADQWLASATR